MLGARDIAANINAYYVLEGKGKSMAISYSLLYQDLAVNELHTPASCSHVEPYCILDVSSVVPL